MFFYANARKTCGKLSQYGVPRTDDTFMLRVWRREDGKGSFIFGSFPFALAVRWKSVVRFLGLCSAQGSVSSGADKIDCKASY